MPKSATTLTFKSIGYIESCFKDRFGTPRQPGLVPDSWAILHLHPSLNLGDGLSGLEKFSHAWVIFVFHQNTNKGIKTKVHPPRLGGEKIGVFATRSPHRPNPIGLSVVKIEKIEENKVYLSGVDLVDGTPVLDIKPYLPTADCLPQALNGWTIDKPERTISVTITNEARQDLKLRVEKRLHSPGVKNQTPAPENVDKAVNKLCLMIQQVLELDPRPNFYKGTTENPNPYTDLYGFHLEDFNVVYQMQDDQATVLRIEDQRK